MLTDILAESLRQVRSLAEAMQVKNVSVQQEDMFELSFPANTFDVVFCDVVILYVEHPKSAVKEMLRVLKPGGTFIISVANTYGIHTFFKWFQRIFRIPYRYGYEKSYSRRELQNLLISVGARVDAIDGFYVAYGLHRLKKTFPPAKFLSKILNRVVKALDIFTNRFFSKHFGFEIFCVCTKDLVQD